jgi:hypothetical protein
MGDGLRRARAAAKATRTVQTPTGDCRYCSKPIRCNKDGIWGARRRDDPHPWYCDANPDAGKRHQPKAA